MKLLIIAALHMWMVSSGSGHWPDPSEDRNCNHYKSQLCATYFRGIMHKSSFFIKLNHLVPKDDDNHYGSVMLRKCNDQHSCWLLTCIGMNRTFNEIVRNNANRKNLKYLEKDLSQGHFVHHKSHMDWPGIEPRPVW